MKKNKCHLLDNPKIKWHGSINLESNYKEDYHYFCTETENLDKVIQEIYVKYPEGIKEFNLKKTNYEE